MACCRYRMQKRHPPPRESDPRAGCFLWDWNLNNLDACPPSGLASSDLMSDENAPSPEPEKNPPAESAPRVRRISNPRIKKPAKAAPAAVAPEVAAAPQESEPSAPAPKVSKFPEFHDAPETPQREDGDRREKPSDSPESPSSSAESDSSDDTSGRNDWPEPEAASSGSSGENNKRKRRRKKGKGGNHGGNQAPQGEADAPVNPASESADASVSGGQVTNSPQPAPHPGQQQRQQQPQHASPSRPRLDPELLAKFAWKIYLSEVSEEGVALIGDNDAKELSRRCFRLAEIFMEEQSRRR